MHAQMPARAQARRNPTWLSATGGTDSGEPDTQGSSTPRIQVDLAPETPSTPSQEDSSSNNFSTTAARLAAEVFASPIFYIVAGRRCAGQPWRWNALGTFVLVPYAPQHPATICSTPTPALPTIHTLVITAQHLFILLTCQTYHGSATPARMLVGLGLIKLVASTGEQSLSIFVFAALPVTLLTLLSKSDLGKVRGGWQGRGGPPFDCYRLPSS